MLDKIEVLRLRYWAHNGFHELSTRTVVIFVASKISLGEAIGTEICHDNQLNGAVQVVGSILHLFHFASCKGGYLVHDYWLSQFF